MAAPVNPAFNKFNSLDRRALNKRQNSNGLLKLVTPTSGPESLPIGKKYVVTNRPFLLAQLITFLFSPIYLQLVG